MSLKSVGWGHKIQNEKSSGIKYFRIFNFSLTTTEKENRFENLKNRFVFGF